MEQQQSLHQIGHLAADAVGMQLQFRRKPQRDGTNRQSEISKIEDEDKDSFQNLIEKIFCKWPAEDVIRRTPWKVLYKILLVLEQDLRQDL